MSEPYSAIYDRYKGYPLLDKFPQLTRDKTNTTEEQTAHAQLNALFEAAKQMRDNYKEDIIKKRSVTESFKSLFKRPNHAQKADDLIIFLGNIVNQVENRTKSKSAVEGYQLALQITGQMFALGVDRAFSNSHNALQLSLNNPKEQNRHHFFRMLGSLIKRQYESNPMAQDLLRRGDVANGIVHKGKANGKVLPVVEEIRAIQIPQTSAYDFSPREKEPASRATKG